MPKVARRAVNDIYHRSFILFCFCAAGVVFLFSGTAILAQDAKAGPRPTSVSPALSPRAQILMNEGWGESSYARGLSIMSDKTETRDSRSVAMGLLHANRRNFKPSEIRQLLEQVTLMAKDTATEAELSAQAVNTMTNLTLTMEELKQLNRVEATKEAGFLLSAATDTRRNIQFRSQAINALGILKISEAAPTLRGILSASTDINVPEIARPACLSLMRIDNERAVHVLADVLHRTGDPSVFGTAAFALGQIKTRESMISLVQNEKRFTESGSCDAAIVDMEDVILAVLRNPQDANITDAIAATRHLWRDGQRGHYIQALQGLLKTAPLEIRKAALDRLLESAGLQEFEQEKRELRVILELIKDQADLEKYKERIKTRLTATLLTPIPGATVPVPPLRKGAR